MVIFDSKCHGAYHKINFCGAWSAGDLAGEGGGCSADLLSLQEQTLSARIGGREEKTHTAANI